MKASFRSDYVHECRGLKREGGGGGGGMEDDGGIVLAGECFIFAVPSEK